MVTAHGTRDTHSAEGTQKGDPGTVNRDLRRYARQTRTRLLAGLFLLLFLLGDGLIYLFYGRNAALMGLLCLLGALVPVAIIILILAIIDRIVKHANPD